jgi:hypothetical protein
MNQEYKKSTIPKTMRIAVWEKIFGEEVGKTKCPCCDLSEITQLKFECGHIVAESKGGETKIENLIPICSSCNKSMGTKNYYEFKKEVFGENKIDNIDKMQDIEILKEEKRNCELKKIMYDKEKAKLEVKKIMEIEKIKKIENRLEMLNLEKENENKQEEKENDKGDIYINFFNEKTQYKEKSHVHCVLLHKVFTNWLKEKYPNIALPSNKNFVANLRKYKEVKAINLNKTTMLGIRNIMII